MHIKNNINKINNSLIGSRAKLIAVSKTKPVAAILEAYEAGQRAFGENYVQEFVQKQSELPQDIQWHFIGHLQSNKAKLIVPFVHLIHAVDSAKLLNTIDIAAKKHDKVVQCLLQVHIAQEETKFGFSAEELTDYLKTDGFSDLKNVKILGLMGMATNTSDLVQVEKEFVYLKSIYDLHQAAHGFTELSMGMSADYLVGAACGATLVRIGSSVFGAR